MASRLSVWIPWLLVVALGVPLACMAYVGWFSRYTTDDFCTAGIAATRSFVEAQYYWWETWSARFTYTAVMTAVQELGNWTPQVLPALAMVTWVGGGAWALAPIGQRLGWPYPRVTALMLGELIPLATLVGAPDPGQSFYMLSGLVTYSLPLILATLYAGWVWREISAAGPAATGGEATRGLGGMSLAMALSVAYGFVAAGLSETTMTVQTAALGLACICAWMAFRGGQRRVAVLLLMAALVGSLLGAGVEAIAPGTRLRMLSQQDGASLDRVPISIRASLALAVNIARRFEALSRAMMILTLTVPAVVGYVAGCSSRVTDRRVSRVDVWTVAGVGAVGFGFLALTVFPGYLVQGDDPPARIQIISVFVLVLTLVSAAYSVGGILARLGGGRPARAALPLAGLVLVLAIVVPLSAARTILSDVPYEAAYAAGWDQADRVFRAAALDQTPLVTVPPLPPRWGWPFLDTAPDGFPNRCVAQLYGLRQVEASGPAPAWSGIP